MPLYGTLLSPVQQLSLSSWWIVQITAGVSLQISCSSWCLTAVDVWFIFEGGDFFLFLEAWYWRTACIISAAFHCWWTRASFRVKGPSRVRRTPLHTAVLRSSSPISCTILRKYFWVSFRHRTSVAEKNSPQEQYVNVISGLLVGLLTMTHLKWSWEAGSECIASLSK